MAWFERIKSPFTDAVADTRVPNSSNPERVGSVLRLHRMALGIELPDAAAALKIKIAYLVAIEEGDIDQLPGAAYALGFVRSYATYLGLDSGQLMRRFRLEEAGLKAKPDLHFPMPLGERSLPGGSVLIAAVILAACGYGLWYHLAATSMVRPERVSEVPAGLRLSTARKIHQGAAIERSLGDGLSVEKSGSTEAQDRAAATESLAISAVPAAHLASAGPELRSGPPRGVTETESSAPSGLMRPPGILALERDSTKAAAPERVAASPPSNPAPAGSSVLSPVHGDPAATAVASNPAAPPAATAVASTVPAASSIEVFTPPRSAPDDIDEPRSGAAPQAQTAANGQLQPSTQAHSVPDAGSRITLRANSPSWIQIRAADHTILFTGLLKAGDTYQVPPQSGLTMRAGNAGGIDIIVDGKAAPAIGPAGAVRNTALDPAVLLAGSGLQDRRAQ